MQQRPTPSPETAHYRARHAITVRHHGRDHPKARETRCDLEIQRLTEHVQRVVAEWPEIPAQKLDRVAGLLCPHHQQEAAGGD